MNYQNALNSNNDDSIMFLNQKMHVMVNSILRKIQDDKRLIIGKETKKDFNEIFEDIINSFGMDEEMLEILSDNLAKKRFQNSINTTLSALKKLQREILNLREV